ncbi:MAG: CBS domain-containing protein [Dermatophilaceae bacterium]
MRVAEFMTSPALTVTPPTSILKAARLVLERNVTALPVVTDEDAVVGIVSRSDLVRHRVLADPRAHLIPVREDTTEPPHAVGQVMTTKVVTVRPTADEAEAAHLMLRHRVKSLPVLDGDRLLGVISVTDILRVKAQGDAPIAAGVQQRLLACVGDEGLWDVAVEDGVVTISSPLPYEKQRVLLLLAETVPGVVRVREHSSGPFAAPSEARSDPLPVANAG